MPANSFLNSSVLITGASQGLGLALAHAVLSRNCASLTIVARDERKLQLALSDLRRKNKHASVTAISADVSTAEGAQQAISLSAAKNSGNCPDIVIMCAGRSTPELFAMCDPASIDGDMQSSYYTAAYTAHAAVRKMVEDINNRKSDSSDQTESDKRRRLVFVSSVAGLPSGLPGYATYAPAKHALRGLADTLHSELSNMFGISTHIFFPASILGKSYRHELKVRPELMNVVEGADDGQTEQQCASILLDGIDRERYMITTEIFGGMLAAQSRGGMPGIFFILEFFWGLLGYIVLPILRWIMITKPIRKYAAENPQKIFKQQDSLTACKTETSLSHAKFVVEPENIS